MPSDPAIPELAGRLRYSIFRLARLLRQQDDTGLSPALVSALAVVERDGPITLGDLAAQEQLSPPTITKVVTSLEEKGLLERAKCDNDKRVSRVRITAKGKRQLESSRTKRTAWLASQLQELSEDEVARLADAIEVIEHLTKKKSRVTA